MSEHHIKVTVNGEEVATRVPARRLLSDFLRDDLGLTGTKRGCETGICGACSVMVDGRLVKSCLSLAVQANGQHIETVEGMADGESLHPIQECFINGGGLQCGYCTPGFVMATRALLAENPTPNTDEIRHALNGNLCRCTGYAQIIQSIHNAAEKLNGN